MKTALLTSIDNAISALVKWANQIDPTHVTPVTTADDAKLMTMASQLKVSTDKLRNTIASTR